MQTSKGLNQNLIDNIVDKLDRCGVTEQMLHEFRQEYVGVHFTLCMDDDISVNAKPVISRPLYKVYLVNSSQHCSVLSNDLSSASGVVIAEVLT